LRDSNVCPTILLPENLGTSLSELSAVNTTSTATMPFAAGCAFAGDPSGALVVAEPVHRY
jgi:hypothetical protein